MEEKSLGKMDMLENNSGAVQLGKVVFSKCDHFFCRVKRKRSEDCWLWNMNMTCTVELSMAH